MFVQIVGLPELKSRIEKELGVEVMLYEQWLGKSAAFQVLKIAWSCERTYHQYPSYFLAL